MILKGSLVKQECFTLILLMTKYKTRNRDQQFWQQWEVTCRPESGFVQASIILINMTDRR